MKNNWDRAEQDYLDSRISWIEDENEDEDEEEEEEEEEEDENK